uniref:hypothetical protein n=1 Tax=Bacillus licheniformis TaxID=1402 RepID=UPI003C12FE72
DEKGIRSEVATEGSVIKVAEEKVDEVKVDVGGEGVGKRGRINGLFLFPGIGRNKEEEVGKDWEQGGNKEWVGEWKSEIECGVDKRNC